jgi:GNAT superfamily N-acetyltransferase
MELVIREALETDIPGLADISRGTWEGHDYLEKVAEDWLADSGFFVGTAGTEVAACAKISSMPGKIAWLEGLRVRSDFRGKGLGRIMADRILEIAMKEKEKGVYNSIEFSTYINNFESRAISEKQGFRITELFHVVGRELDGSPKGGLPVSAKVSRSEFEIYPEHAPCGWKYVHWRAPDAMDWMAENALFWRTGSGAMFLSSKRGFEISPLASSLDHPEEFIREGLALAASRGMDYLEMMVHDRHENVLKAALSAGFEYWEEPGKANIPLYRYHQ